MFCDSLTNLAAGWSEWMGWLSSCVGMSAMADHAIRVDYRALAEFQDQLTRVVAAGESRMRQAGLKPCEYQVLLAIKAHADGETPTLGTLAKWLQTDRNSLVEPIESLVRRGFVDRKRDDNDRRRVLITLTSSGEQWLQPLAEDLLRDLVTRGPGLLRALRAALTQATATAARPQTPARSDLDTIAWKTVAPPTI
jgi:DNA-binding MarR family transcriptional regulator